MEILVSFAWAVGMWLVVQIIRIAMADCDLTMQWAAKFGRKPSKLIGKVVWITGASSGIGEYLAYELAKAGCLLILSARRNDKLECVKAKCLLNGPLSEDDVLVLPLDITQFDTHADAVKTVLNKFNRIDILVNNAGRGFIEKFDEIPVDKWRDVYDLNAMGPISLTRAVLPHMYEKKRGQIVVMSSLAGKIGVPGSAAYCAAKHALHVYTNIPTKRMTVERCAFLCAAAISNKIQEAWICLTLELIGMYVAQYTPSYGRRFMMTFTDRVFSIEKK